MSSLQVPLLFWRPQTATVPLLEVSLAPTGGGATHGSVRRPFEVLDQSLPPLSKQILPTILPRFAKLEHYSCSYVFPPRDVDQFTDEFPQGLSHLLMISLAFYALGADETCGGTAFCEALRGWTATGYPDKNGQIQPVAGVEEKLRALARENEEIASLVGQPVQNVILSAGNREAAEGGFRFHVVSTFDEALEAVFGSALLDRYARTLRRQRLRPRVIAATCILAVVALAGLAMALRGPDKPPDRLVQAEQHPDDHHLLALRYGSGQVVFYGPFDSTVNATTLVRGDDGEVSAVVVGLSREGDDRGSILWLQPDGTNWKCRWTAQPFLGATQSDGAPLALTVSNIQVADVLEESPGDEIIAAFNGEWYTSALCILSTDGKVLRTLWHCGVVDVPMILRAPTRLLVRATGNGFVSEDDSVDPAYPYNRVFFMIRPEDMNGRSPWNGTGKRFPAGTNELPMAPFDFYIRVAPRGRGRELHFKVNEVPLIPGAEFVTIIDEWYLSMDGQGNVLRADQGDNGGPTEQPVLVRIR